MSIHPLRALVLATSLLLSGTVLAAPAAAPLDIQQVLKEERAWAGLTSKTLTVGDIQWAYSEGGDPAKPTVMLVHGLSGSRDNWNRVARYLTPSFHVVIPDLPLHGDTRAPENYDAQIASLTESLRRFAEAGNFTQNLHIAGHSLGGAIAGLYASMYFQDTQSLLLVDTAGVYASAQSPYLKDPNNLRQLLVQKPGDFARVLKIAMNQPPFIPGSLLQSQEQLMISHSADTARVINRMIETYGYYTPDSFATAVRAIEAPTLVIWGEKDAIIDAGVVPELTANLKNEEPPVILQGIGHTPILEAEQLVVQHYLPFLRKAQATPNKFAPRPAAAQP
jgi:pimeloyl-ACP methyl ester carboxylesterase